MTEDTRQAVSPRVFDFLGDLTRDTHGVWEVFAFIRLHHPKFTTAQRFREGVKGLKLFHEKGWVKVADRPHHPAAVKTWRQLETWLQNRGEAVADGVYRKGAPSVEITRKGIHDYESGRVLPLS